MLELRRGLGEYALAALAEDATPAAFKEGHVKDPRTFFFGVFNTDPFMDFRKVGHDFQS